MFQTLKHCYTLNRKYTIRKLWGFSNEILYIFVIQWAAKLLEVLEVRKKMKNVLARPCKHSQNKDKIRLSVFILGKRAHKRISSAWIANWRENINKIVSPVFPLAPCRYLLLLALKMQCILSCDTLLVITSNAIGGRHGVFVWCDPVYANYKCAIMISLDLMTAICRYSVAILERGQAEREIS